jgi:hypothetical protein
VTVPPPVGNGIEVVAVSTSKCPFKIPFGTNVDGNATGVGDGEGVFTGVGVEVGAVVTVDVGVGVRVGVTVGTVVGTIVGPEVGTETGVPLVGNVEVEVVELPAAVAVLDPGIAPKYPSTVLDSQPETKSAVARSPENATEELKMFFIKPSSPNTFLKKMLILLNKICMLRAEEFRLEVSYI